MPSVELSMKSFITIGPMSFWVVLEFFLQGHPYTTTNAFDDHLQYRIDSPD